jgi:hypothetical protein
MALSASNPGRSEFSHGKGLAGNPGSDYQSQRKLAWDVAERDQGSKRGGYTANMKMMAEKRLDSTLNDEVVEDMLYVLGNSDYAPGPKIVKEPSIVPSGNYAAPKIRLRAERQE